jgi:hypothetical protein
MFVTVRKYEIEDSLDGDFVKYVVYLEDDTGNEQTVSVYCSLTLKAVWEIEDERLLFESLYPLVRDRVISLLSRRISRNINEVYPLSFTTHDAPNKPPVKRYLLPDKIEIENITLQSLDVYAVFICHAIEDKQLGNNIKRLLEDFDIKSFVAHDDIELGDIWEPKILETIKDSKIIVTLGTKEIESSSWVNFETGLGYDKMFPIFFDKLTDRVSYINNKQGIIMDYDHLDTSLLKLINKVLSKLGLSSKRKEDEIKSLPSFKELKQVISEKYKDIGKTEEIEQSFINKDWLYIYRRPQNNFSLAEIFNRSDKDLIDLNITLEYLDKVGKIHKNEAKVINSNEDPLYARAYICKLIRRNESKLIISFPRTLTKVTVTGKESTSGNNFEETFEVRAE